ncbi:hypothetical protein ACGF12_05585 [Kitasatospora sp. NPDC048296]|uniref:hypothetical protein n=1 Tax=Kitasatospora sp. NPDC048296 TaxID=3364048 RepID=UPI00371D3056
MFVMKTYARSAAVDDERHEFRLLGKRWSGGLEPARPITIGVRSRAVLELHRTRGGVRSRALLGGEYVSGEGERLDWRVRYWETVGPAPQPGLLHEPLLPSLPEGLDDAVTAGLYPYVNSWTLPAGRLVIDRAGYDRESSPLLFSAAAELLLHVLLARAFGAPAEPVLGSWVTTGGAPAAPLPWAEKFGVRPPERGAEPPPPNHRH